MCMCKHVLYMNMYMGIVVFLLICIRMYMNVSTSLNQKWIKVPTPQTPSTQKTRANNQINNHPPPCLVVPATTPPKKKKINTHLVVFSLLTDIYIYNINIYIIYIYIYKHITLVLIGLWAFFWRVFPSKLEVIRAQQPRPFFRWRPKPWQRPSWSTPETCLAWPREQLGWVGWVGLGCWWFRKSQKNVKNNHTNSGRN